MQVFSITGLRYFDATHNRITVLLIAGLRYFDATHNQITVLPSDFGNLKHLEQLYLRHNKLQYLPLLSKCHNLKVILRCVLKYILVILH